MPHWAWLCCWVGIAVAGPAMAQGKLLKFVPEADLRSLDPIWTTAYITRNHGYMVYDVLFATDANFKVSRRWSTSTKSARTT